jgi:hypothetical protein
MLRGKKKTLEDNGGQRQLKTTGSGGGAGRDAAAVAEDGANAYSMNGRRVDEWGASYRILRNPFGYFSRRNRRVTE